MLDVRALCITPGAGATYTLGVGAGTVATGDGAPVAGVPLSPNATLMAWAFHSVLADTLSRLKLSSQDQTDPINGEDIQFEVVATGIMADYFKFTNLPYKTGQRILQASTNTGVTAGLGILLDGYPGGPCIAGDRFMPNQVVPVAAASGAAGGFRFGAAMTSNTWQQLAYAPATQIPNGKYAILGAQLATAITTCWLRFRHADFGAYMPGFPVWDPNATDIIAHQPSSKHPILKEFMNQFVYLSEVTKRPCCPVFSVSNAGTGLIIEGITAGTDQPFVALNLAKVG